MEWMAWYITWSTSVMALPGTCCVPAIPQHGFGCCTFAWYEHPHSCEKVPHQQMLANKQHYVQTWINLTETVHSFNIWSNQTLISIILDTEKSNRYLRPWQAQLIGIWISGGCCGAVWHNSNISSRLATQGLEDSSFLCINSNLISSMYLNSSSVLLCLCIIKLVTEMVLLENSTNLPKNNLLAYLLVWHLVYEIQ